MPAWDNWEFVELPFDVMESIFKYLEPSDLKSLMHIDYNVRDVIQTCRVTMRKLPLYLNENWDTKCDFVESCGEFVKEAICKGCVFEEPKDLCKILSQMGNLEILRLTNILLKAENMKKQFEAIPLSFPKLRSIQIDNSPAVVKIIQNLRSVQVRELKLDFSHLTATDDYTEFLCQQKSLEKLTITGWDNIILRSLFYRDISFHVLFDLTSLKIFFKVEPHDNFKRFLMNQPELQELELHKEVLDEEIFNIIFRMENLKSLLLRTNFVSLKNIDLKKISHSKLSELQLITRSEYGIDQTINTLVTKLLDLKSLKIIHLKTDSSDQLLGFVNLKKLENFYVENSKLKFIQNIKLDRLKRLHIRTLHIFLKFGDWENFFKDHPTIEELIVEGFECSFKIPKIKQEIQKIIYNLDFLRNLKHFEIFQEIKYQKPIKLNLEFKNKVKSLKISDSFIKHCRDEFHFLRQLLGDDLHLYYYADDDL